MGNFRGGSAPAMARQIADGYVLVNVVMMKRFTGQEIDSLLFELDKIVRKVRADQPPLDDTQALQLRNRTISRIDGAMRTLRHILGERKRKGQ